jgi:hypothetical protein
MPNTPHDDFSKAYLEELLSAFGQVHLDRPVKSETRRADVWFVPDPQRASDHALYNVANSSLKFLISISREKLRPEPGDGFQGAPLHFT